MGPTLGYYSPNVSELVFNLCFYDEDTNIIINIPGKQWLNK